MGITVFNNLRAELARNNINAKELAEILNLSQKTVYNKLKGKSEFTLSEILKVQEMLPDSSLEYLFETELKRFNANSRLMHSMQNNAVNGVLNKSIL